MGQTPGDEKQNEPSLELPSLSLPGFGRRKKSKRQDEEPSTPEAVAHTEDPPAPTEPTTELHRTEPVEAAPAPAPARRRARKERKQPTERQERSAPAAPTTPTLPTPPTPRAAPAVPGQVAAAVTGLIVGAVGGAATYGAMAGCEAVRGVSSCGGAPGFFILVAILALMVLLGMGILKAFGVSDPGSTSFLAVGVVAVVAMLVLLDVIFSPAMFVVIPVLSAVAFLLARWVTTRFDEEATGVRR